MQSLVKAVPGNTYTIKWMFGLPEVLDFLQSCQVKVGSSIQIIQKCGSGLVIGIDRRRIVLSNDAAARIQV